MNNEKLSQERKEQLAKKILRVAKDNIDSNVFKGDLVKQICDIIEGELKK